MGELDNAKAFKVFSTGFTEDDVNGAEPIGLFKSDGTPFGGPPTYANIVAAASLEFEFGKGSAAAGGLRVNNDLLLVDNTPLVAARGLAGASVFGFLRIPSAKRNAIFQDESEPLVYVDPPANADSTTYNSDMRLPIIVYKSDYATQVEGFFGYCKETPTGGVYVTSPTGPPYTALAAITGDLIVFLNRTVIGGLSI